MKKFGKLVCMCLLAISIVGCSKGNTGKVTGPLGNGASNIAVIEESLSKEENKGAGSRIDSVVNTGESIVNKVLK